jgi:D-hydroxyproline dehydrogenase subunit alpha
MAERRCDIAVIGAGPAGIAAAVTAAGAGRCVIVLDEARHAGGQIWRHAPHALGAGGPDALPRPARRWLERFRSSGAELLYGCAVVDAFGVADPAGRSDERRDGDGAGFRLVAERGGETVTVDAATLVVATGARERFLPFPGWTLPGVVGAGGVQALLRGGLRVRGRRVVVAGSGPLLLAAAAALARAGARVVEVAEQAPARRVARFAASLWRTPLRLAYAAALRGAFPLGRFSTRTWVLRAEADAAGGGVGAVVLTDGRRVRTVTCDLLCTGYGLVPAAELARLLGCVLDGGAVAVDDGLRTSVPGVLCAGEPTGVSGVDGAVLEGRIAGIVSAGGEPALPLHRARATHVAFGRRLQTAFALRPELRSRVTADTIVCRCEDVPLERVAACGSAREAKLGSRAGMGPCQGRVCGPALEFLFGWPADTVRVPVLPARIETLLHGAAAADAGPGRVQ